MQRRPFLAPRGRLRAHLVSARRPWLAATTVCLVAVIPAAGTAALAKGAPTAGRTGASSLPRVQAKVDVVSAHAAAHAAAVAAIAKLPVAKGGALVQWQRDGLLPEVVAGLRVPTQGSDAVSRARFFLDARSALVGAPSAGFSVLEVSSSYGRDVVRLQRRAFGLPVLDWLVSVTMDAKGTVLALASDVSPVVVEPAAAKVSAAQAQATARAALGALGANAAIATPEQALWQLGGQLRRVWVVQTVALPGVRHERVLVDAVVGEALAVANQVKQ